MSYYQEGHNGTVKSYRSAQTLENHFIPCRVSLVGYIQQSRTFSSDPRDLAANQGQTYPTLGQIYLTSQIYPAYNKF
jgi:hypothetical protein